MTVTKDDVIRHLRQLRDSLTHSLRQPHISAGRFNEIREQLMPLDQQLRDLGVDLDVTPEMSASHIRLTRTQRRKRHRQSGHSTYETRAMQRLAHKRMERDDDAND